MISRIDVHIDVDDTSQRVATLKRDMVRARELMTFDYRPSWLTSAGAFALDPALPLSRNTFVPDRGRPMFGALSDSAPDTWGRRLMQRAERRRARAENRAVRTLLELDYLLGVSDETRMGALRFSLPGSSEFLAPSSHGVPALIELPQLLAASERYLRDEDSEEDLRLILAPGSSLGGARPKASVRSRMQALAIAKFPKDDDPYSIERWEAVALTLAAKAGIEVSEHELVSVQRRSVLLSRRFDRRGRHRIPYLSAMSMLELADGDRASYPDIADALGEYSSSAKRDRVEIYRRMAFNVLASNVDDHLRNHGFLWRGIDGWRLSPAFDVNPVPVDVRPRILTTNISPDDGTCDIDLVLSVADYFGLSQHAARSIVAEVGTATAQWRNVAKAYKAPKREIERLASAFEHRDAERARSL